MWRFRRSRHDTVAPVVVHRAGPADWRHAPRMSTVVDHPFVTADATFEQRLTTRHPPSFLAPLGHYVSSSGPSGSVTDLARPVPPAAEMPVAARQPLGFAPPPRTLQYATVGHPAEISGTAVDLMWAPGPAPFVVPPSEPDTAPATDPLAERRDAPVADGDRLGEIERQEPPDRPAPDRPLPVARTVAHGAPAPTTIRTTADGRPLGLGAPLPPSAPQSLQPRPAAEVPDGPPVGEPGPVRTAGADARPLVGGLQAARPGPQADEPAHAPTTPGPADPPVPLPPTLSPEPAAATPLQREVASDVEVEPASSEPPPRELAAPGLEAPTDSARVAPLVGEAEAVLAPTHPAAAPLDEDESHPGTTTARGGSTRTVGLLPLDGPIGGDPRPSIVGPEPRSSIVGPGGVGAAGAPRSVLPLGASAGVVPAGPGALAAGPEAGRPGPPPGGPVVAAQRRSGPLPPVPVLERPTASSPATAPWGSVVADHPPVPVRPLVHHSVVNILDLDPQPWSSAADARPTTVEPAELSVQPLAEPGLPVGPRRQPVRPALGTRPEGTAFERARAVPRVLAGGRSATSLERDPSDGGGPAPMAAVAWVQRALELPGAGGGEGAGGQVTGPVVLEGEWSLPVQRAVTIDELGGGSPEGPSAPAGTGEGTTSQGGVQPGAASPARPTDADLDELSRRVYSRLRSRICRDLLVERERAGYRTDIRF